MKIGMFCHSIETSGTYFRWHNLAIGLRGLGHEVLVWAIDPQPGAVSRCELRDGVAYSIQRGLAGNSWFSSGQHPLTALRRTLAPVPQLDIAHLFQPFLSSAAPWWLRARRKSRCQFYDWDDRWEGGLISNCSRRGFRERWVAACTIALEQRLPRLATHMTTCSVALADRSRTAGAQRVSVLGNGFWPRAPKIDRSSARREFGFDNKLIYAGFMGRTITGTERDWLFSLTEILPENVRLVICGIPDEVVREHLPVGHPQVVSLGVISPERSRIFAAALDLGLIPLEDVALNRERYPIKFSEYLAAGIPVVCTRVGDCAEHAKSWRFVRAAAANRESWHSQVLTVVREIDAGARPIVDRNLIASKLSWAALAQKLEEAYRRALRGSDSQ